MNLLGIDLGGTKIALAKYQSTTWKKLSEEVVPTKSSEGFEAVLDQLVALIKKHHDEEVKLIGIGVPGPTLNGVIERFPNIPGAVQVNLKTLLYEKLSTLNSQPLTLNIENDANCWTVGAWQLSEHKKMKNIIGLTIGTGVGGGIVINGELYRGRNGAASEFGHMIIREGKSVENLVSGKALRSRWEEQFQEKKKGEDIIQLAIQNDSRAKSFLEEIGKDFGIALANLILAFNPETILIGGSAAAPFPFYQDNIRRMVQEHCFSSTIDIPIEVVADTDCATYGAAWMAKKELS